MSRTRIIFPKKLTTLFPIAIDKMTTDAEALCIFCAACDKSRCGGALYCLWIDAAGMYTPRRNPVGNPLRKERGTLSPCGIAVKKKLLRFQAIASLQPAHGLHQTFSRPFLRLPVVSIPKGRGEKNELMLIGQGVKPVRFQRFVTRPVSASKQDHDL